MKKTRVWDIETTVDREARERAGMLGFGMIVAGSMPSADVVERELTVDAILEELEKMRRSLEARGYGIVFQHAALRTEEPRADH